MVGKARSALACIFDVRGLLTVERVVKGAVDLTSRERHALDGEARRIPPDVPNVAKLEIDIGFCVDVEMIGVGISIGIAGQRQQCVPDVRGNLAAFNLQVFGGICESVVHLGPHRLFDLPKVKQAELLCKRKNKVDRIFFIAYISIMIDAQKFLDSQPRGTRVAISREIGVTKSTVSGWLTIPWYYAETVAKITGVPAYRIRPDRFPSPAESTPAEKAPASIEQTAGGGTSIQASSK